MPQPQHYNQTQKRRAEFITPPNTLKEKVGSGGLADDILEKAQALIEENTVDFAPLAAVYLGSLMKGIEATKNASALDDNEYLISTMLYPAVQLKSNGQMFHYPLITAVADKLIQFLEVIEAPDIEAIEIVMAFHTTMQAIMQGKVAGNGGAHGKALMEALNNACVRYFEKYPENNQEKPKL